MPFVLINVANDSAMNCGRSSVICYNLFWQSIILCCKQGSSRRSTVFIAVVETMGCTSGHLQ